MGILFLPRAIMGNLSHIFSSQSLSSNPLFSTIITLYILILIYFPHLFFKLLVSPLLLSIVILLSLLRLGTSQQIKQQQQPILNPDKDRNDKPSMEQGLQTEPKPEPEPEPDRVELDQKQEEMTKLQCHTAEAHTTLQPDQTPMPETCDLDQSVDVKHYQEKEADPFQSWAESQSLGWAEPKPGLGPNVFLEWDVGAPLEVIYEAYYEGEEEGEGAQNEAFLWNDQSCKEGIIIERYPSLSRYYPESESGSDSYSESSSSTSLDEQEEEEREGLIEIALDYEYGDNKGISNSMIMKPKLVDHEQLHFDEEDNLIEIDISPTKKMSDFSW